MRKRQINTIKIDGKKLKDAIKSRGLTCEQVSLETGRGRTYIAYSVCTGIIAISETLLLDKLYGIKPSEYEYVEPEPEPVVETPEHEPTQTSGIDYVALYNTIYAAVYAALKANAEDMKDRLFKGGE
jgi:hypothetical protein